MSFCPECDAELRIPDYWEHWYGGAEWPEACPECGVRLEHEAELVDGSWKPSVRIIESGDCHE